MNLRERLADWISGGALTLARDVAIDRLDDTKRKEAVIIQRNHYSNALSRIAACETPNANATVRRMARIAREALK